MRARAFTIVELLVVIAVVALLVGLVLPSLSRARESARGVACLSNLRQAMLLCRAYADENRGRTPTLGVPYETPPNWGLVIQSMAGLAGSTREELFRERSVLVCASASAAYGGGMTRTYAMNATGHAGQPGDPDNYDAGPVSIRLDQVDRPEATPIFVDSARSANTPTPSRTASVLDFRQARHVGEWLGRWHPRGGGFNAGMADGSASRVEQPAAHWVRPLP